jgi:hypothetical protein
MKFFSATSTIQASKEKVWAILTDGPNFPAWDPSVIRIEGAIVAGGKVVAYSKISPNRAFPAVVTEFVPGQRMAWTGGMPFGLFKGVRTFTLTPQAEGRVNFTLREEFSGPLLPMIGGSIADMTQSFQEAVAGLKAYAERS